MYQTSNSLVSAGYNSSFAFNAPSPSGTPYATTYTGIGGSPNRTPTMSSNNSEFVRSGWASVKDDSVTSFFWSRKWLVLNEQSLAFHKNEVRYRVVIASAECLYIAHFTDESSAKRDTTE